MPVSPLGSTNRFLNNRGSGIGTATATNGGRTALSSIQGRVSVGDRYSIGSGQSLGHAQNLNSDLNQTIKQRQGARAAQKQQDLMQTALEESEAKRIADQTAFSEAQSKYAQDLVNMNQQNLKNQGAANDRVNNTAYGSNYTGDVSTARGKAVSTAYNMLGTPYAWGGGGYKNPGSRGTGKGTQNVIGVDCSGLTQYIYGQLGIKIPRTSRNQVSSGVRTSVSNAKPGDLIGWRSGKGLVGHVAIYVGNGYIIHSPKPGSQVKKVKLYNSGSAFAVSYL